MSKLEDNVNEILGIEKKENSVQVSDFEQPAPVPRKIDENKTDIDNDYTHSRDNYYNLIDKGNQAIDGILDIAKEGQHPRAYEVAVAAMKHVADMTEKLQDLHKKMKDLGEEIKGPKNVTNNAMFVGSTTELQKMLKQMGGGKR